MVEESTDTKTDIDKASGERSKHINVTAAPNLVVTNYEETKFYISSQNYFVKFSNPKVHEILLQGKQMFAEDLRKTMRFHLYYNVKEVPSNTALRVLIRICKHIDASLPQDNCLIGLWFVTEDEKTDKKFINAVRLEVKGCPEPD
jgi:hypothetical protein